jgi:hypothetical protein
MNISTRKTLLQAASIVTAATGLATALAALPATAFPMTLLADVILWPFDGANSLAATETRLLAAIGGGVMAGWGLMMLTLVNRLFLTDPALTKGILMTGVVSWFAIDSSASVLAGAPLNILPNVVFLALFAIPLSGRVARVSHI